MDIVQMQQVRDVLLKTALVANQIQAIRKECGTCSEKYPPEFENGRLVDNGVLQCTYSADPDDDWCPSCQRWEQHRSRWEDLKRRRGALRRQVLRLGRKLLEEAT